MGIFDSMSNAANRGVAAAERTGRSVRLRKQADDLLKQRKDYAAQLGASLYETTKDMPEMREGREPLYAAIEDIDRQRQEIADELEAIEAAAQEQEQASQTYECSKCGNTVMATDLYCSGCGRPVSEIKEEAEALAAAQIELVADAPDDQLVCPDCGYAVEADDAFCMACGAKLGIETQQVAEEHDEATSYAFTDDARESDDSAEAVEAFEDAQQEANGVPVGSESQPIALQNAEQESSSEQPSEEALPPTVAFCMQCGKPVAPDDAFCGGCGRKL